jgi:hypothetical protein
MKILKNHLWRIFYILLYFDNDKKLHVGKVPMIKSEIGKNLLLTILPDGSTQTNMKYFKSTNQNYRERVYFVL